MLKSADHSSSYDR